MLFADRISANEFLVNLIENHPSCIVVFDSERRIVYLNQAALKATGGKREDFVGCKADELLPPDVREQYLPAVQYVQENEQAAAIEIALSLDGEVSSYKVDFIPAKDAEGDFSYIFAYINDISGQKKKEQEIEAECRKRCRLAEKLEGALREKEAQSSKLAKELALEHKKLSAVIDSLPIGVGISDFNGKTLSLNKAGLEAFGLQAVEEMHLTIEQYNAEFELRYPDGSVMPAEEWPAARAIRGEYVKNYELLLRRKSREHERVLSFSVVPLLDDKGNINVFIYMVDDLTERKKVAEALRVSEAAMEAFFAASPGILLIVDRQARIIKSDKTIPAYFGLNRRSIVGKSLRELNPIAAELTLEPVMKRVLETGEPFLNQEVSATVPSKGEGLVSWLVSCFPVPLPGGKKGLGAIGLEITKRKKTEEDLRKSERKYRAIFEGSNDPIVVIEARQRKYLDVNERFCNITGFSKEEILAMKSGTSITPPHLQSKLAEIIQRLLKERALIYDWEIQKKTGEIIPVQISSRLVEVEGKDYVFSMLRDMRSIKAAEEILKRDRETLERLVKERTKALLNARRLSEIGTLASTIAHELRNPLTAIQLGAYNIRRKTTEKEKIDKHLKAIEKKVAESNQIIDDLLHFVRVKPPQLMPVDLCELILDSERIAKGKYQKKGIQIFDNTSHLKDLLIRCDPVQLQEVISNVLNNAFEALGGEGRIDITIISGEIGVKIIVQDNGPGLAPEIVDKLFEPFVSTKSKGTGLGLAISKQIVENHNGTITIDSEPGKGTAVTIALPK